MTSSTADPVHLFGIRHHGPGCARSLTRALRDLQPDCVLIGRGGRDGTAGGAPVRARGAEARGVLSLRRVFFRMAGHALRARITACRPGSWATPRICAATRWAGWGERPVTAAARNGGSIRSSSGRTAWNCSRRSRRRWRRCEPRRRSYPIRSRRGAVDGPSRWPGSARVAQLLREAEIDCSSAPVIECVRLAELLEAARTVLTTAGADFPLRRRAPDRRRPGLACAGRPGRLPQRRGHGAGA